VKPFPDAVLKRLEQLARVGEPIPTDQAREILQLTDMQYQRMCGQNHFPKRQHVGRKFWLDVHGLLAFAQLWNALTAGLTITQVAVVIHASIKTTRRMIRQPGFPEPLGEVNDRERWDREAIVKWHRGRMGGAKLPAEIDAAPITKRKTAKGAHNGKAKTRPEA
jgi:hypothetical protein